MTIDCVSRNSEGSIGGRPRLFCQLHRHSDGFWWVKWTKCIMCNEEWTDVENYSFIHKCASTREQQKGRSFKRPADKENQPPKQRKMRDEPPPNSKFFLNLHDLYTPWSRGAGVGFFKIPVGVEGEGGGDSSLGLTTVIIVHASCNKISNS